MRVNNAGMAKLVDAPDLGSGVARRVGSTPITRTTNTSCVADNSGGEFSIENVPVFVVGGHGEMQRTALPIGIRVGVTKPLLCHANFGRSFEFVERHV